VDTQRTQKKKYEAGLQTAMTNEKLQHLSSMDFQWNERNNATWDQQFEELKKFRDEHGHCRVPRKGKFGGWVKNQKARRAFTSKEKIIKLNEIGLFD
jgi:hypothetical protein